MTSKELIADFLLLGQQPLPTFLNYLADRVHDLRLADGQSLNDGIDFAAILRELAAAARFRDRIEVSPVMESRPSLRVTGRAEQPRWSNKCPVCDHEHEDKTECRKYLGEGKFCQCEEKVSA